MYVKKKTKTNGHTWRAACDCWQSYTAGRHTVRYDNENTENNVAALRYRGRWRTARLVSVGGRRTGDGVCGALVHRLLLYRRMKPTAAVRWSRDGHGVSDRNAFTRPNPAVVVAPRVSCIVGIVVQYGYIVPKIYGIVGRI